MPPTWMHCSASARSLLAAIASTKPGTCTRQHCSLIPKNATANSALSTLPATGTRNLDESALKNLLREQPGAANLHFALGLQYVAQGRWPDAQNAFFEAVKNEPTNADYAYNLAVSLDRLKQAGPAAAYYQRALELATASALFNQGAARERLATLRNAAP